MNRKQEPPRTPLTDSSPHPPAPSLRLDTCFSDLGTTNQGRKNLSNVAASTYRRSRLARVYNFVNDRKPRLGAYYVDRISFLQSPASVGALYPNALEHMVERPIALAETPFLCMGSPRTCQENMYQAVPRRAKHIRCGEG